MSNMPTPEQSLAILDGVCSVSRLTREEHEKCRLAIMVLKHQVDMLKAFEVSDGDGPVQLKDVSDEKLDK